MPVFSTPNWVLSSVIPAIVLGGLVASRRVLVLSRTSYVLLGVVHFAFGLLLASPIRDVFACIASARGFLLYYLPVMTIAGLSGLWEVLESASGR